MASDGMNPLGFGSTRRVRALAFRVGTLALIVAALALTIFPFDWLAEVWPAYRTAFDRIFVSPRDHAIGHATLFAVVGLVVLWLAASLRTRPVRYLGLGLTGALAQEVIQALAKRDWPNLGDIRDIGFDLIGLLAAFALVFVIGGIGMARRGAAHSTGVPPPNQQL